MITLEAILFLVFGLVAGRLFYAPGLDYYILNGSMLLHWSVPLLQYFYDLVAIGGFIVLVIMARQPGPRSERRRFWTIFVLAAVMVIGTSARHAVVRATHQPWHVTHDGALQTEAAAELLLAGKNPYAVSYVGTILDNVTGDSLPASSSPKTHYAYPPLTFLVAVPMVLMAKNIGTVPEVQMVYVIALFVGVIAIVRLLPTWRSRSLWTILTLGNPFIFLYPVAGYNDALAIGLVLLAVALAARRQWGWAGLAFGLALGAKQLVWAAAPLWAWWLWLQSRMVDQTQRRALWRSMAVTAITAAVIYGPFLVWNAPALYDDLIRYVSGNIPLSYPIGGSTLWQLKVILDPVHNAWGPIPSTVVQVSVGLVMLALMMRWLQKNPTLSQLLFGTVMVTFGLSLTSRFVFDNYLSSLVWLGAAAFVLADHEQRS
ncbi:MAG: DUF2029 domain-containing protein [Candidatus Kerfeldbacteria bacterium]|nr:DUF2029 domain-containing protein [Candidatus Kerfeldbacteria bacterium]